MVKLEEPKVNIYRNLVSLNRLRCFHGGHVYVCMCIRNWPLPIGAFQDQCKLIVINEHNLGKNPNWREADQLAIYKRRRGHVSNDVTVLSIVKPQIGWEWVVQLSKVLHIFILCFYLKKLYLCLKWSTFLIS